MDYLAHCGKFHSTVNVLDKPQGRSQCCIVKVNVNPGFSVTHTRKPVMNTATWGGEHGFHMFYNAFTSKDSFPWHAQHLFNLYLCAIWSPLHKQQRRIKEKPYHLSAPSVLATIPTAEACSGKQTWLTAQQMAKGHAAVSCQLGQDPQQTTKIAFLVHFSLLFFFNVPNHMGISYTYVCSDLCELLLLSNFSFQKEH